MALDGFTLSFMTRELSDQLLGGRVDKINQPERDLLVMLIRNKGANHKLLLSANANNARVQITEQNIENPAEPPVLCMLARKHFTGARVADIRQLGCDRVLTFTFQCINEMGDEVQKSIVAEIMGRHSNLTLVDENSHTIDCVHHVNADISRVRVSMPGKPFTMPPEQDKLDPFTMTADMLAQRLSALSSPLHKGLIETVSGLSAASARELCAQTGLDEAAPCGLLNCAAAAKSITAAFERLQKAAAPVLLCNDQGQGVDYLPFPFLTFARETQRSCASLSAAMDACYGERELAARMKQRGEGIHKRVKSNIARLEKKREKMLETLSQNDRAEQNRVFGELLTANLHLIGKGAASVKVVNYYDEAQAAVDIPLQPELSAARNAQAYYKKYRKAKGAQQYAQKELGTIETELETLETVLDDLDKCTAVADLNEIRYFLIENGFLRPDPAAAKHRKLKEGEPYRFRAADGTEITVGKNSVQNDRITLHARPDETWLHAQGIPGSHVLIRSEAKPADETLLLAAKLALYFSKGRNHPNFPVDYTKRKHVKKKSGTPAGFVIYQNFQTIHVGLSAQDFETIKQKVMETAGGVR